MVPLDANHTFIVQMLCHWVIPEKIHTLPKGNFLPSKGGGILTKGWGEREGVFLISSVGGVTDLFWENPLWYSA